MKRFMIVIFVVSIAIFFGGLGGSLLLRSKTFHLHSLGEHFVKSRLIQILEEKRYNVIWERRKYEEVGRRITTLTERHARGEIPNKDLKNTRLVREPREADVLHFFETERGIICLFEYYVYVPPQQNIIGTRALVIHHHDGKPYETLTMTGIQPSILEMPKVFQPFGLIHEKENEEIEKWRIDVERKVRRYTLTMSGLLLLFLTMIGSGVAASRALWQRCFLNRQYARKSEKTALLPSSVEREKGAPPSPVEVLPSSYVDDEFKNEERKEHIIKELEELAAMAPEEKRQLLLSLLRGATNTTRAKKITYFLKLKARAEKLLTPIEEVLETEHKRIMPLVSLPTPTPSLPQKLEDLLKIDDLMPAHIDVPCTKSVLLTLMRPGKRDMPFFGMHHVGCVKVERTVTRRFKLETFRECFEWLGKEGVLWLGKSHGRDDVCALNTMYSDEASTTGQKIIGAVLRARYILKIKKT